MYKSLEERIVQGGGFLGDLGRRAKKVRRLGDSRTSGRLFRFLTSQAERVMKIPDS